MSIPREWHTATLLGDGTVLVAGVSSTNPEIYHPAFLVPSPRLLAVSGEGGRQGAILHAGSSRVVSAADPAMADEALEIYLTGLTDGGVIPPQISIGGRMAEVLWFGNTPGMWG